MFHPASLFIPFLVLLPNLLFFRSTPQNMSGQPNPSLIFSVAEGIGRIGTMIVPLFFCGSATSRVRNHLAHRNDSIAIAILWGMVPILFERQGLWAVIQAGYGDSVTTSDKSRPLFSGWFGDFAFHPGVYVQCRFCGRSYSKQFERVQFMRLLRGNRCP